MVGDVTEATLMDRAGEAIAQAVARLAAGREILVLCGPGNNGGDGYIAATSLRRQGLSMRVAASEAPRSDGADGPPRSGADLSKHWIRSARRQSWSMPFSAPAFRGRPPIWCRKH